MIELKNLTYRVPHGEYVFKDLSMQVGAGDFFGVLGRNGAGKTTLLELLMGIRRPTGGEIRIFGEDPRSFARHQAHQVSFMGQDLKLKQGTTVGSFLSFHRFFYPQYDLSFERELLEYFSLDPEQKIGALSTGQQKKIIIVAGLASCSKLILIDEVTAVLDPETRLKFFNLLSQVHHRGESAMLLATNIVEDLKERVDQILFIDDHRGRFYGTGQIDELFQLERSWGSVGPAGEVA